MKDVGLWLPPILVGAGIAAIGWLIRNAVGSITNKLHDLEAAFTRVTADLAEQHRAMEKRIDGMDRRLTRVESWKEIMSLPDPKHRDRRITDKVFKDYGEEDHGTETR